MQHYCSSSVLTAGTAGKIDGDLRQPYAQDPATHTYGHTSGQKSRVDAAARTHQSGAYDRKALVRLDAGDIPARGCVWRDCV